MTLEKQGDPILKGRLEIPMILTTHGTQGQPRPTSLKTSSYRGFPGGLVVKNLPANAGDVGLIPGSRRSHVP